MQDTIEWMIERRMCDYGDESEWRRRSGLEPLPAPKPPVAVTPAAGGGGGSASPIAIGGREGLSDGLYGGGSSEVINLLSDSDD